MKNYCKHLLVFILISSFGYAHAQSGCTDPAATNYDAGATTNDGSCLYSVTHNTPVLRGQLSSIITESSGLVLTDGKLWTHNDSGNPNDIYSIDTTDGHTLQTVTIDNYPNVDWEDIAADSNYIYVGDFGNNNGTRTDLKILKIKKTDIGTASVVHVNAQAISFAYTDQTSFTPSNTHNFDCESLIAIKDSLYIFTKDRGDMQTRVYKMPKIPGTYNLSPYTGFNVNGLITGADYNPNTNEIILIGYLSGHTYSFLWFLNDFKGDMFFSGNKRRIEISNGKEWQTEGVCFISNNRFFISCESTDSIDASLFVSDKSWLYTNVLKSNRSVQLCFYPNPVNNVLYIENLRSNASYSIQNISGQIIKQGVLYPADDKLDLNMLGKGFYILNIENPEGLSARYKIVK